MTISQAVFQCGENFIFVLDRESGNEPTGELFELLPVPQADSFTAAAGAVAFQHRFAGMCPFFLLAAFRHLLVFMIAIAIMIMGVLLFLLQPAAAGMAGAPLR